jgi:hypothetical protein
MYRSFESGVHSTDTVKLTQAPGECIRDIESGERVDMSALLATGDAKL